MLRAQGRNKPFAIDALEHLCPDQTLKSDSKLGRLQVTSTLGDFDGDGDYDALFAFGGRSFSIRDAAGNLVYDIGIQCGELWLQPERLCPSGFARGGKMISLRIDSAPSRSWSDVSLKEEE